MLAGGGGKWSCYLVLREAMLVKQSKNSDFILVEPKALGGHSLGIRYYLSCVLKRFH
jgi:hypothetical protein